MIYEQIVKEAIDDYNTKYNSKFVLIEGTVLGLQSISEKNSRMSSDVNIGSFHLLLCKNEHDAIFRVHCNTIEFNYRELAFKKVFKLLVDISLQFFNIKSEKL